MPFELTPDLIRAIQGLEFGTIALLGSALVVLITIGVVRNVVKNQGDDRKAESEATQLQFENQAKLITHIGTQSTSLEKMADAMLRLGDTQRQSADSNRELVRINTDGFAKTTSALTDLSQRLEHNQAATLDSLKELRDEMSHVQRSLVQHTESHTSLASRLDTAIVKLDQLIAQPQAVAPPASGGPA